MGLPVIYVFTHDSFCVGEDGPTHQPIEQLVGRDRGEPLPRGLQRLPDRGVRGHRQLLEQAADDGGLAGAHLHQFPGDRPLGSPNLPAKFPTQPPSKIR